MPWRRTSFHVDSRADRLGMGIYSASTLSTSRSPEGDPAIEMRDHAPLCIKVACYSSTGALPYRTRTHSQRGIPWVRVLCIPRVQGALERRVPLYQTLPLHIDSDMMHHHMRLSALTLISIAQHQHPGVHPSTQKYVLGSARYTACTAYGIRNDTYYIRQAMSTQVHAYGRPDSPPTLRTSAT